MPPIKIYETLQQSNTDANNIGHSAALANRGDEFDFFKKDDEMSKKDG